MSEEGRLNRRNQIFLAIIGAVATVLVALYSGGFFEDDAPIDKDKVEQETWGPDSRNVR